MAIYTVFGGTSILGRTPQNSLKVDFNEDGSAVLYKRTAAEGLERLFVQSHPFSPEFIQALYDEKGFQWIGAPRAITNQIEDWARSMFAAPTCEHKPDYSNTLTGRLYATHARINNK